MAIVSNTFLTFDTKGIREDLTDFIYDISPDETPFMSNAGRGKAKQTLHEWQVDSLAAAVTNNAQLEGDDVASFPAVAATTRIGNYLQIARKLLIISGTNEVVDKAGRKSELAYQLAKRGAELKLDMESAMLANIAAVAGNSTTARVAGSMGAFIKSNTSIGAGGVDPVYTTVPNNARTDGTQRAFTEALLKDVIAQAWTEGARPNLISLGSFNKQAFSAFAGVATKTFHQSARKETAVIGAADVYVSDFGTLSVVANRNQRARDGWVLDMSRISVVFLRKFSTEKLAKTGDAEKRMLIVEYTLRVENEKSQGLVADLTTA